MRCILILLALCFGAHAQPPVALPGYIVAAGWEYGPYVSPRAAAFVSFGARISTSNIFSYSTVEMTKPGASLRTGAAYLLKQTGNWSLLAIGDGGLLSGDQVTLGGFSAGTIVTYDVSRFAKTPSLYLLGAMRILKISSVAVQPAFQIGIAKGF